MNIPKHLENILYTAQQDLSTSHILQHTVTASLSANLINADVTGIGAHSVGKQNDTVILKDGHVTGKKHWISNIPNITWVNLHIKNKFSEDVVIVKIDNTVKIEMITTSGMEGTLTGHFEFTNTPVIYVCNNLDAQYFSIMRQNSMAFIANHYGLARALFNDINLYTGLNYSYEKQKLKLQLSTLELLWQSLDKEITDHHRGRYYTQQKDIIYAFAKQTLLSIIQFMTETTGSGLYQSDNLQNQRYRDALIYVTHMKNLSSALACLP
jgi:hypothetical protein